MSDSPVDINQLLRKINGGFLRGAQTALAKKLNVRPGTVSRWITGGLAMGEETAVQVAKALGVTPEELHRAIYGAAKPALLTDAELRAGIEAIKKSNEELRRVIHGLAATIHEIAKQKKAGGK